MNAGTVVFDGRDAGAVLRANAAAEPDRPAVTFVADPLAADGSTTLTYRDLDTRARSIAADLQRRYPAGSRVLLLLPTSVDAVAAFAACLYAGMVAVFAPMPGRYRHERARTGLVAVNADVSVALTESSSLDAVTEWAVEQGIGDVDVLAADTIATKAGEWQEVRLDQDSLALLQYTSGSTADPKGVMITHGNLLHNILDIKATLGIPEHATLGGWCPLYHDMGLMGQVSVLFLAGTCVLMNPMTFLKRPHLWLAMVDRFGLDMSSAPNFAYELCARRVTDEQLAALDLSRWQVAGNGSEPVHVPTMQAFAKRFAEAGLREEAMSPCFGMAEATVLVTGDGPNAPAVQRVDTESLAHNKFVPSVDESTGSELTGCGWTGALEVRIVDEHTLAPLPDGEIGEVVVRGPSVAQGYWRNENATARTFGLSTADGEGGFMRTGDLGVRYDGQLYITGRIKEMLIIHGRNLYPQDIEQELRQAHPELAGTVGAVFSTADPGTPCDAVVAVHELRGRFSPGELKSLADSMKQTIGREFGVRVEALVLVRPGSVARTTSGKIQRGAVRQAYLADGLNAVHTESEGAA